MPILARHLTDLLRRIWIRWLAFLGITVGGIVTQGLIRLLSSVERGWFLRNRWRRWRKQGRFKALIRTVVAVSAVWGITYLRFAIVVFLEDRRSLQAQYESLSDQNRFLTLKLNAMQKRATHEESKPRPARPPREPEADTTQLTVRKAFRLFDDILSYLSAIDMNRPTLIFASTSPALTERSLAEEEQFERYALLDFFRRFSGPIYDVERGFRDQGIDTSRLDTHLAQLVNTQMFRLLALDVKGMAEELENRKPRRQH